MLIEKVVREEARRNQQMIEQYEQLLAPLPKGSLICRRTGYYYLKYREGETVFDVYIGRDGAKVETLREQLQRRRHYQEMLSALRKEQKKINKVLEGLT